MRVLYIIPPYHSEEFRLLAFPLGPAYIMASLKNKGHDVQCLNLSYENKSLDILLKQSIINLILTL